jgi:8-oxo-dGTP pyrophosphatase MutT (NUDIX family)
MTTEVPILDVFQRGLRRGAAKLPYAPHKRYFYVEHPTEGWRVYLRACTFLHEAGVPFDQTRFLVVKRYEGDPKKKTWEPPKGQMEGKDTNMRTPVMKLLEQNVRREVSEEAKVRRFMNLRHTGKVLQSQEPDYPKNHYFQYHCFQAFVTSDEIDAAAKEFNWLNEHKDLWEKMPKDVREKDALAWFNPRETQMMGRWSPTLVAMYLSQ